MIKFKRAPSDEDMAPFETFYIQYPSHFDAEVRKMLEQITQKYATFKFMQHNQLLEKEANKHYQQIKLTKRKKTFAVMAPLSEEQNPESVPSGCRKITITNKPTKKEGQIFISKQSALEDVQIEMIKALQLDSVWVGLLYRIGTDFQQLQQFLVQNENFQSFQIGLMSLFQKNIQSLLQKGQPLNRQLLDRCKLQVQQDLIFFNHKVEELVRMKFNSRTVLKDITMHPYLNLLSSRSYFNLIYIQAQIINRFNYYKSQIEKGFPSIHKQLTLENFITIDDYIYTEFIFPCLKRVKKYINRTLDLVPYPQIVRKLYKDIIREFRPSVHEYFLSICLVLKERAACLKQAVGSIIVKNKSIISTGYNGTPMGTINCYNGGCKVCNNSEKMSTQVLSCRCIHAEYNCILTAGITQTPGATLYSSKLPCLWCVKLIIQGSIKEVIYIRSKYSSLEYENVELVKKTLKAGKVELLEMQLHFND